MWQGKGRAVSTFPGGTGAVEKMGEKGVPVSLKLRKAASVPVRQRFGGAQWRRR